MPVYTFVCEECEKEEEIFLGVDERDNLIIHHEISTKDCNGKMIRQYKAPSIKFNGDGYTQKGIS